MEHRAKGMVFFEGSGLGEPRSWKWGWVLCLIISFLVGVLYLNSLSNQFTNWDDGMIYNNGTIRDLSWEGIKRLFRYEKSSTYQPVRMLSYAIDYRVWKLNPVGYRITNILFYILTCVMVFLTLKSLSTRLREEAPADSHGRMALFGSLLFAAHPVHVEAVTWLAARKEVLQGFFLFLAFYLYLKGRGEGGRKRMLCLAVTLFSILVATLSKPSAIVFPAVLLIYEIAVAGNRWVDFVKRHWVFFVSSMLISLVFGLILIRVMLDAGGVKPYHGGTFFSNLITSFYAFVYNIKLLAFTINYSAAYTIAVTKPLLSPKTGLFVGAFLLLFGGSLWSLKKTKVIFFSFFFFLVTLLPYLNFVPISTLLADRYVFIASFSYCFVLGIIFDRLYRFRRKGFSDGFFKLLSVVLFLFLLAGYSLMTIRQNQIWENSYTLWADAVEKYPDSNTANALLGVAYMEMGMDEKALIYLEKAVWVLPYDYQSRNNLGIVYGRLDEPEKAEREFMTALRLNPDGGLVKINLAAFYQKQRQFEKARALFHHLLSKTPDNAYFHFRLGLLYKDMEQYGLAVSELLRSMELAPEIINPYEELGNIYLSRIKDAEKAKFYYEKGIERVPRAKTRVEELRWIIQDLECYR